MPPSHPSLRSAVRALWIGRTATAAGAIALVLGFPAAASAQSTNATASPASQQMAATRQMAARLQTIFAATDWRQDPSKPAQRAAYYRSLLDHGLSATDSLQVLLQMAIEQLQAGDTLDAIAAIATMRRIVAEKQLVLPPAFDTRLRKSAAIADLRLGEQDNCMRPHQRLACIFPIHGSGVHTVPRGAEAAVQELTALLERTSDQREAWQDRWLLNVASMQLGRYPAGVPARWRIPASLFRSDADVGSFPNVAAEAGLTTLAHSGGIVVEDLDNDGLLDLVFSSSGPLDPIRLYHNNGDGTFTDRTLAAGLAGETGGLNIIPTDYDNDGHIDLLVLRGGWWGQLGQYPLSLLHNRGDGTFADVTVQANLFSPHPTQTAAWADYDGDGWLDLFVGHETEVTPQGKILHPSQLFHNNRDGTFTEVGASMGLANLGFVKGVAWGDFNNDGRPDLYVSVKGGPNHLLRNDGPNLGSSPPGQPWRFTDITAHAGVAQPVESFATWFFDYNNDGWPDLFAAGYSAGSMQDVGAFELDKPFHAETPRLYRNNRDGTFTDVTHSTRLDRAILTMGAGFGDLDNDGWLDLYLGTGEPSYEALLPNRMFRNDRGQDFEDVTTSDGFGNLQKGHGVAFADLCNTGHEDVIEEMGGAYPGDLAAPALFRNPGNANHSITLLLEGVQANRAAIGARLDLAFTAHGGVRHLFRTVGFGSSFGASPLRQHLGLESAGEATSLEVRWPGSNNVQIFSHLQADRAYRLREGDPTPHPVPLKRCTLGGAGSMGAAASVAGTDRPGQAGSPN